MVDRFDLTPCEGESGRCLADFDPAEDGEWVMYEDYKALADKLASEEIAHTQTRANFESMVASWADERSSILGRLEGYATREANGKQQVAELEDEIAEAAKAQHATETAWRADREKLKAAESRLEQLTNAVRAANDAIQVCEGVRLVYYVEKIFPDVAKFLEGVVERGSTVADGFKALAEAGTWQCTWPTCGCSLPHVCGSKKRDAKAE